MNSISFEDFKGLTKAQAKSNVAFSFEAEKTVSDVTGLSVRRNAIFRTDAGETGDKKVLLGLVPEGRPIIPYSEVTDWMCNELDKTGVEYKILDSTIHGKTCSMQQRYVMNLDIGNPDGYKLSPMMIVESSYTGLPVALEMGTYRFICSNGVTVGGDVFERTKITARRLQDFGKITVGDVIRRGLDKIVALKDTYQRLDDENWEDYFMAFLDSPRVDVEFKKHLIQFLYGEATLAPLTDKTLKNEDFIGSFKLGEETIANKDKVAILHVDSNKNKSAWDLYNDMTYIASHESSSILIRDRVYHMISEVFAA